MSHATKYWFLQNKICSECCLSWIYLFRINYCIYKSSFSFIIHVYSSAEGIRQTGRNIKLQDVLPINSFWHSVQLLQYNFILCFMFSSYKALSCLVADTFAVCSTESRKAAVTEEHVETPPNEETVQLLDCFSQIMLMIITRY